MASRTRPPSKISGQIVKVSGEHVYVESGVHVVVPDVSVSGSIVQISGQHVFVESGVHTVVESGLHVQISGQHVFVESGVQVVATVDISGQPVKISGEHVYVESGVYTIGGFTSGAYFASGIYVGISGQHVFVESGVWTVGGFNSGAYFASGVGVQIQSGAGVLISGQHLFVESGVFIASGVGVTIQSGVHVIALEETQDLDDDNIAINMSHPVITTLAYGYDIANVFWRRILVDDTGVVYVVMQSGVGVVIQSGVSVLISGQHVYVESGVYLASGIYVVAAAASGTYQASGVGVIINSGVGVTVQSGIILLSGWFPATMLSGLQLASGGSILVSGQGVIVGTATLSGLRLISGQSVTIDPATLSGLRLISGQSVVTDPAYISGLRLISGQSVTIASGTYVNWVQTSGTVAIQSGEIHIMSGAVTIYLLSSEPIINNSGNPIVVGAISHGIPLWSAGVISVTVKALSINSGDIYMGGFKAGQGPFSGQGFLMEPGEAINMDVDNTGKVHLFAEVSGDRASYIAVTG